MTTVPSNRYINSHHIYICNTCLNHMQNSISVIKFNFIYFSYFFRVEIDNVMQKIKLNFIH